MHIYLNISAPLDAYSTYTYAVIYKFAVIYATNLKPNRKWS